MNKKDGDVADITVSEFPNRNYAGTVTRHPDALDQATRTMLVEVDLPNPDRSLYPGMYADMKMTAHVTTASINVPDDALVFRDDKVFFPVIRDNHLKLSDVTLGHDNGYNVEVSGDLRPGGMSELTWVRPRATANRFNRSPRARTNRDRLAVDNLARGCGCQLLPRNGQPGPGNDGPAIGAAFVAGRKIRRDAC